jgi:hypothetical protein
MPVEVGEWPMWVSAGMSLPIRLYLLLDLIAVDLDKTRERLGRATSGRALVVGGGQRTAGWKEAAK